ncbi:MAG: GDYXXLXY domain-containing protein [Lentisphaeria bacterium]|nr:GDYXXLXY domain-containing protein [Lentisphaeria bacterium]
MKRSDIIRLVCYAAALVFILFYPVRTIRQFMFPATKGIALRFPVMIYDPYDPMRGRYVRLGLTTGRNIVLPNKNRDLGFRYRQNVFAVLDTRSDSPKIVDLVADRKEVSPGAFFLPVQYLSCNRDYDTKARKYLETGKHQVQLPFERFYLNEHKAPKAEKLLQKRNTKAELLVIVYPDGVYQVKDLFIDGTSVRSL